MQIIMAFIIFTTLLCMIRNPHFVLANLQHPDHGIRGNESDYEALLAFKAKITSDPHSVLSSWNNSFHFCHWEGVTCGRRHRRVVSLNLDSSNLAGTLSSFIGNISFLHQLSLYNNSFQGDIPPQISRLSRLRELNLTRNSFRGEIPANLSQCLHLRVLSLGHNNLAGKIPSQLATLPNLEIFDLYQNRLSGDLRDIGIGNMSTSMQGIYLSLNHLEGSIPNGIGRLKNLLYLYLSDNVLSGTIPTSLFNLSNLNALILGRNKFHGHLPQDLGLRLPHLSHLHIANLSLIGQVPTSPLSNLSKLEFLDISYNSFNGNFSINGNSFPHLSKLFVQYAFSLGGEARDLNFVDTLTNCTKLTHLFLVGNSFTGNFPHSIVNLSTSLEYLNLASNQIFGKIPVGLGKFAKLLSLILGFNHVTGPIPLDIGKLESLQAISFPSNNLSGEIPSSLGNLTHLSKLIMEYNNLQGPLPKSLGNCKNLEEIFLTGNKFSGQLPVEIFHDSSLVDLLISQNEFQGSLPVEISKLKILIWLDASQNRFFGEIPSALGECTSLEFLDISQNSFFGPIPESLSSLKSIQSLNLSCNNFSGQIPNYFSTWPYLSNLDLSFNKLSGEIPTNGIFSNTSILSIAGNVELCGGVPRLHLPQCPKSKRRRLLSTMITIISITCALILVLSVTLFFYFLCSSRKKKDPHCELQSIRPFIEVSYGMLHMATNGFSLSNLIGVGGFGSVYRGILCQDDTELMVAVKVINLQNESTSKGFIVECKALRNIRHRNLVKIITACSSIDAQRNDFKALVYEFMPRGSLEKWLHSSNPAPVRSERVGGSLSLFQRLSIAIDVASALEYLHIECANPMVHCDIKPSNILLDDEMIAHVGDFGLAKFLLGPLSSTSTNQTSSNQVRGTVGYTAPEYGLGSKVSLEGDIYSFGIVILELMTSKKPTDPMFNDGLNLHDFAKAALPSRVMEIVDQTMLGDTDVVRARTGADIMKIECIKSLIMIGVQCSRELSQERMTIKDVINELKSAKKNLLALGIRN